MFTTDADFQRADWPLLQNGAVNLFWRSQVLAEARKSLDRLGYEISVVNCRHSRPKFYEQFSYILRWEEQFGYHPWTGGLDALKDGFRDYPFSSRHRSALILDSFHFIANEDSKYAHAVLDIIETAARNHLLRGNILVCLVRTDDNHYECSHLGCHRANWNSREWSWADRGLSSRK